MNLHAKLAALPGADGHNLIDRKQHRLQASLFFIFIFFIVASRPYSGQDFVAEPA